MIPKIIHYCWFGRGEMPPLAIKCLESWKRHLPEFEIMRWDEENFDIDRYSYVREAYDNRRFAFVTDVVRLYALYNYGGVYMDTDVEVLKPIDSILNYEGVSGFETDTQIPTGLMASVPKHPMIGELLAEYNDIHFCHSTGSVDLTTNVERITRSFLKYGLKLNNSKQTINDFTLLPKDFLCPKSYEDGKIHLTENTLTIHHFAGSWYTPKERIKQKVAKILGKRISGIIVGCKAFFKK